MSAENNLCFYGNREDEQYLRGLKGCVGANKCFIQLDKVDTISSIRMHCEPRKITGVISTSIPLLKKLLHWDKRKAPSISDYSGSWFKLPEVPGLGDKYNKLDIEVVFIPPLKHLVTVPHGKFVTKRLVSKIISPDKWYEPTAFSWNLLKASNEEEYFAEFSKVFLIAVDIETFKTNATIRCISYTAFMTYYNGDEDIIYSKSVVLPLDSIYNLTIMRKWNWQLKAPKVLANGKYDISYLCRYNAPLYAYLYDVQNFFHSWYSELPKSLGYLNSFFIREAKYWKDLAQTDDLYEYYRYNALDTWGTGNVMLAMILEAPAYAFSNYALEFPLVFPCHLSEMTGIDRDMKRLDVARIMQEDIVEKLSKKLDTILGVTGFNVASPLQMKQLLTIIGCKDLKSADEKSLKKARFRHPLNARIIGLVMKIRKARTLLSNYLQVGEKSKEFHRPDGTGNRMLFALNPHGTDSSRLASKEHHFWCGTNIQKIPRPDYESSLSYSLVKYTYRADPGFCIAEVDLEQAESRDTAYIAGEKTMIEAVEHSPDFHSANASAFFGVPFNEIFDVDTRKVLNKRLRDIAKNVNHGANYNMGWYVLIDTMGEEKVIAARNLLQLPKVWSMREVSSYLLDVFHKTYPGIRGVFYKGVVNEIARTHMLTSTAVHHPYVTDVGIRKMTDDRFEMSNYKRAVELNPSWTRYCFSDPNKSKSALNSYISHPPQSLNAQTLNKGVMKVFTDIAIEPEHAPNFKLIAQIHDSILFQYRIGHSYLCDMVKERMEIPVTLKSYDGVVRTFTVPAGIKAGGKDGVTYWSDI